MSAKTPQTRAKRRHEREGEKHRGATASNRHLAEITAQELRADEQLRTEAPQPIKRYHDDKAVLETLRWIRESPTRLLGRIGQWKDEDRGRRIAGAGPGGRKPTVPLHAIVVLLLVAGRLSEAMTAKNLAHLVYDSWSPRVRRKLGIAELGPCTSEECTGRHCDHPIKAGYRRIARALRRLEALVDAYQVPLDRRIAVEDLDEHLASLDLDLDDLELRYDRLAELLNALLQISIEQIPKRLRPQIALANTAIDSTFLPISARPGRPGPDPDNPKQGALTSTDPSGGWYIKTTDNRDRSDPTSRGDAKPKMKVVGFGLALTTIVFGPHDPRGPLTIPTITTAMAPASRPGTNVAHDAIVAMRSHHERGLPKGFTANDLAYTAAKPANYAMPAAELGFSLVHDYRIDQCGIQATINGAIHVEGTWYCPEMPDDLINATIDYRHNRIDWDTYLSRIDTRADYTMRRQGDGFICPASNAYPIAHCDHKAASYRQRALNDGTFVPKPVRRLGAPVIPNTPKTAARSGIDGTARPKVCEQDSVTLHHPEADRFGQQLPYMSPQWHATFRSLRSTNEGAYGTNKNPAGPALGAAGRRRMRGAALNSIFAANIIAGTNITHITSFCREARALLTGDGEMIHYRPRNRATSPDRLPDPRGKKAIGSPGRAPPKT